jgi:hypothetical protein
VLSAAAVVRIVTERNAGRTLQSIANGLQADGVPTARGGAAVWRVFQVAAGVAISSGARRLLAGTR